MLERVAAGGRPEFRTWICESQTVVLGRSAEAASAVDAAFCLIQNIEIVRRASGGGTVMIGPGTLQWAFALPHTLSPELSGIPGAKRFCNEILVAALKDTRAGTGGEHHAQSLTIHASGDLLLGDRKVGGIALKRKRYAGLVHGTILINADLELIDTVLRHPPREPDYRKGRSHDAFLANLVGPGGRRFDRDRLEAAVLSRLSPA